jgi:hypothetical protein
MFSTMKKFVGFSLTLLLLSVAGVVNSYGQAVSPGVDLIEAMGGTPPAPGDISLLETDCDTDPGLIITDDGTIENGYSGNPALVSSVVIVEKFAITDLRQLMQVCMAFVGIGGSNLDIEVVVFDDDGPGGTPGTELAAMPASLTGIPGNLSPVVWHPTDLSALNLLLENESVYIGARWSPGTFPNRYLATDQSAATPMQEGYVMFVTTESNWQAIQSVFPSYKSMFIRPQMLEAPIVAIPFATWSILIGMALMLGFVLLRFFR